MLIFERNIIRMVFGPKHEHNQWKILYNDELRQIYHHPNAAQKIRAKRSRWAGHVARMEPNIPTRKVFESNPEGDRRPGRPRTRWVDLVETDARMLRIPMWKRVAQNRTVWRTFVDKAESIE